MASVDNDRLRKVQLNVRNGRTNINTDISNIYESGGDDNFNTISVNFSSIHLIHKGDLIDLEYIFSKLDDYCILKFDPQKFPKYKINSDIDICLLYTSPSPRD